MVRYTAKMNYSEDTIYKLTEMQHRTFHPGRRMTMIATAIAALFIGFHLGLYSVFGILCFFTGCILLTGLNARPRATAKMFVTQLAGKYPSMKYTFTEYGFSSQQENKETPYSSIIQLVDDGYYYYLYVSAEKAYMVDSSTLRAQDKKESEDFKEYISRKTGQSWTRPTNFLNFNIHTVKRMIKR